MLSVGLVNKISRKNHVGDQSPLSNAFAEARVSLFTPFYLSRGGNQEQWRRVLRITLPVRKIVLFK